MITDLTEGKPSKILWSFSIPMLLSVVFQQLYNIVDSIVAGKFVGAQALAAVGASYPITMIFMAIATGAKRRCGCYYFAVVRCEKILKTQNFHFHFNNFNDCTCRNSYNLRNCFLFGNVKNVIHSRKYFFRLNDIS